MARTAVTWNVSDGQCPYIGLAGVRWETYGDLYRSPYIDLETYIGLPSDTYWQSKPIRSAGQGALAGPAGTKRTARRPGGTLDSVREREGGSCSVFVWSRIVDNVATCAVVVRSRHVCCGGSGSGRWSAQPAHSRHALPRFGPSLRCPPLASCLSCPPRVLTCAGEGEWVGR